MIASRQFLQDHSPRARTPRLVAQHAMHDIPRSGRGPDGGIELGVLQGAGRQQAVSVW